MEISKNYDVIIIGGSYAGLSAAMALGRSLRNVLIIDSGKPCNEQTPHSHNFLTQDGVPPAEIASIALEQILRYSTVELLQDRVVGVCGANNDFVVTTSLNDSFAAKKLIFATGIKDEMPPIEGFAECWGISVIHCPYCHGYEYAGKKTGIMLNDDLVSEFAPLIANLTNELTIYTNGKSVMSKETTDWLERNQIRVQESELVKVVHSSGQLEKLVFADGSEEEIDALYARLPFVQHCPIPEEMGCKLTAHGYIEVNEMKKTSLPGVYAVGDATYPMRSVANAVSSGNFAGAAINRELAAEQFS